MLDPSPAARRHSVYPPMPASMPLLGALGASHQLTSPTQPHAPAAAEPWAGCADHTAPSWIASPQHEADPLLVPHITPSTTTAPHELAALGPGRTEPGTSLPTDFMSHMGSLSLASAFDDSAGAGTGAGLGPEAGYHAVLPDPWDTSFVPSSNRQSSTTPGSSLTSQASKSLLSSSIGPHAPPLASSLYWSLNRQADAAPDDARLSSTSSLSWDQQLAQPADQAIEPTTILPGLHALANDHTWPQPASSCDASAAGGQLFGTSLSGYSNLSSGYSTSQLGTPAPSGALSVAKSHEHPWGSGVSDKRTSSESFPQLYASTVPPAPTTLSATSPATTRAVPWERTWAPQAADLGTIGTTFASTSGGGQSGPASVLDRWVSPAASSPTSGSFTFGRGPVGSRRDGRDRERDRDKGGDRDRDSHSAWAGRAPGSKINTKSSSGQNSALVHGAASGPLTCSTRVGPGTASKGNGFGDHFDPCSFIDPGLLAGPADTLSPPHPLATTASAGSVGAQNLPASHARHVRSRFMSHTGLQPASTSASASSSTSVVIPPSPSVAAFLNEPPGGKDDAEGIFPFE